MPRKKSAAKKARENAGKAGSDTRTVDASPALQKQAPTTSRKAEKQAAQSDGSDTEDSSSEEEDDFGELVTEEVEDGFKQVLAAIKNNDKALFDPSVRFFDDPEKAAAEVAKQRKEKPVFLKDYHRMNILSGETFKDDDDDNDAKEMETVDGKQSFVSEQREGKTKLLNEINDQFKQDEASGEDGDDDDFLVKKEPKQRKARSESILPNPEENDEEFLQAFVSKHAWVPQQGDKDINLDDPGMQDDEEFEDAAEQFENAYNFRYEDPNAAEIISYARNQATLRRGNDNSRRRKRDEEKKLAQAEKKDKDTQVQKKKTEKVNKLTDVLEQVKKEYGADIDEAMVKKLTSSLINGDFEDNQWDAVVSELFNDEYYNQKSKPTWDENDEIMGDFYQNEGDKEGEESVDEEELPAKKKSRKDKKQEKSSQKKEKKKISEMVEKAVDNEKLALVDQVEEERKSRSRTKDDGEMKFRYREVSPESFGLSYREIFAADDTDLNDFIGLKKFAPYRAKELRAKDRRKVTKSRRVREWRKKTFGTEEPIEDVESLPIPDKKSKHSKKTNSTHNQ
ncbi:LAFA_0G19636g1_1 [Lachancea sp. 'fantastica']|nr:LAFA_0G19636g1_1 [Lachancea sp. 'fantastica']